MYKFVSNYKWSKKLLTRLHRVRATWDVMRFFGVFYVTWPAEPLRRHWVGCGSASPPLTWNAIQVVLDREQASDYFIYIYFYLYYTILYLFIFILQTWLTCIAFVCTCYVIAKRQIERLFWQIKVHLILEKVCKKSKHSSKVILIFHLSICLFYIDFFTAIVLRLFCPKSKWLIV